MLSKPLNIYEILDYLLKIFQYIYLTFHVARQMTSLPARPTQIAQFTIKLDLQDYPQMKVITLTKRF